jgi:hypothetical protein
MLRLLQLLALLWGGSKGGHTDLRRRGEAQGILLLLVLVRKSAMSNRRSWLRKHKTRAQCRRCLRSWLVLDRACHG